MVENIGKGLNRRRIKQVCKETCKLVSEFKKHLREFIPRNIRSYWQNLQLKECINNLSNDVVVSIIDFGKNYMCKVQNEVQSQLWYNDQHTTLVHICYWKQEGKL